ncbi:P80 family lipoprotein [Mycoplasmoides gallisepticum]|uniref:P68 family surface lipoprotein n=1 Tax=Mycoplasmoides gallisepticum TaxID=2096 RepID=UPI003DA494B5
MKLIKKLSFALLATGLSSLVVTSCNLPFVSARKPEKIVLFQSAQNSTFPLDRIMHSIVDKYNTDHKDNPDFLKVVYQNADITQTTSEFNLANSVATRIRAGADNIPSVILGSISAPYLINQLERLLDVSTDSFFSSQPIINEINEITKNIIGVNHITQNALPFDLTDLDALYFNKPVMQRLFTLFKQGGGKIDENSKIYNQLQTQTALPANNFWSTVTLKNNEVFKDKTINDSTFDNLESIFKFSSMIYGGLNLTNVSPDTDQSILEIDYDRNLLTKYIWSKLGNSEKDFLWNLKAKANNPRDLVVNFDNLKKQKTIDTTKKAIQFWYDNIHVSRSTNDKDIRSIKLNNSGRYGFSFNDIRDSNAAFAIGPTVTLAQATISKYSIDTFISNKENKTDEQIIQEAERKFTHPNDIYWAPQLTKMDDSDKKTYQIGGSYLIPISSGDPGIDKATINFLKYLYSVNNEAVANPNDSVVAQIENGSGYFVPLKTNISSSINEQRKTEFDNLATKYDFSKIDLARKVYVYKNQPQEWDSYYYTQAGLITREGIDVLLSDPQNVSLVNVKNDSKTAKIFKFISDNVIGAAAYNAKVKTPDEIMNEIRAELRTN